VVNVAIVKPGETNPAAGVGRASFSRRTMPVIAGWPFISTIYIAFLGQWSWFFGYFAEKWAPDTAKWGK